MTTKRFQETVNRIHSTPGVNPLCAAITRGRVRYEFLAPSFDLPPAKATKIYAKALSDALEPGIHVSLEPSGAIDSNYPEMIVISYRPGSECNLARIRRFLERIPTDGGMPKRGQNFFPYD